MASIHQIYDERLRRLREIEEEASDMIGKNNRIESFGQGGIFH
jgi:hypothetical protein